jgi:hypothetical protein
LLLLELKPYLLGLFVDSLNIYSFNRRSLPLLLKLQLHRSVIRQLKQHQQASRAPDGQ